MECVGCGSAAVTERPDRTAQGYRRFRCWDCGKQFDERSAGVPNRASLPSDIIAFVVFCQLRYRLYTACRSLYLNPLTDCRSGVVGVRRIETVVSSLSGVIDILDGEVELILMAIVRATILGAAVGEDPVDADTSTATSFAFTVRLSQTPPRVHRICVTCARSMP